VKQESFIHEAAQYALWAPFAALARYAGEAPRVSAPTKTEARGETTWRHNRVAQQSGTLLTDVQASTQASTSHISAHPEPVCHRNHPAYPTKTTHVKPERGRV